MISRQFKVYSLSIIAGLMFGGCSLYDDVTYKVNPDPLELHGDSVRVSATATVPEKSINKSAIADVTPVLRWAGGERALKTIAVQGEKAAGNGTVINSKTGGTFSYSDIVPYEEGMMKSELFIKVSAGKGTNRKELEEVKIADGVITTPYLVQSDDRPVLATDQFKRITKGENAATINYKVNSAIVRANELKDEDMTNWQAFLDELKANQRLKATGVQIDAYASPEGEVDLNTSLSDNRAESAKKTVDKLAKRKKLVELESVYNERGLGEDWDGFRTLMEQSNIEDKDLIIRILETYGDVNQREQEIKNLSRTYLEIADEVLPKLRRSEMVLAYDIIGYSDEELINISKSTPDNLNLEELLYAAPLHSDLNDQVSVYKNAESRFTNDNRAANNIGAIFLMQGKDSDAAAQFKKADNIASDALTANNLGIIARRNGDRKKAAKLFRDGLSAGKEASYNLGIVNIQDGDYAAAVSNMSGIKSVNSALATLLNGDAAGASAILGSAADGDSATADYLRAIIAARQGDTASVTGHLQSAISKDASLKDRAMNDAEFLGLSLGL